MTANDKLGELYAMGPFGAIAIDQTTVNIDDLLNAYHIPGGIVRVYGSPHESIMLLPSDLDPIGCICGWISEDEAA